MSALCSGLLADLVKTVEAAKGRKELVPWLVSAPTLVIGTLPEPASPYVLLSTRSSCPQSTRTDKIDGDGGSSCGCCSYEPCDPNERALCSCVPALPLRRYKRQARVPNKSKSQSAFVSLFSKKKARGCGVGTHRF